ncbi:MAG: hypothetical protein AAFZ15_19655 [Bacteroidota bacterium]
MKRKKILFIGGSLNQTTMMYRIAQHLPEHDLWFTSYYADGLIRKMAEGGLLDFTILGGHANWATETFFQNQELQVDYRGERNDYDLVVTCSDSIIPKNIRSKPIVLVQEGMVTPENWVYHLVRALRLPRYMGNTSMTGLSHRYQKFCVASEGFKELFIRKGVRPECIEVTGIPNFDNLSTHFNNDFPFEDFVLGATSCLREAWQYEDRKAFIFKTLDEAGGRQVIFKLHPNEDHERAKREIKRYAPHALIFEKGDIVPMIANCHSMVTKYSSVLLVALGLDKPIISDLKPEVAETLRPVQNGGRSGEHIAELCRTFM